jgi:hypothetical protein
MNGGVNTNINPSLPAATVQEFIGGTQSFVAVAAGSTFEKSCYNVSASIPLLDQKFNKGNPINFRIVDTGGAFGDKTQLTHIDISFYSINDGPERGSTLDKMWGGNYHTTVILGGSATAKSPNTTQKGVANLASQGSGTATGTSASAVSCSFADIWNEARSTDIGTAFMYMTGCAISSVVDSSANLVNSLLKGTTGLSYLNLPVSKPPRLNTVATLEQPHLSAGII